MKRVLEGRGRQQFEDVEDLRLRVLIFDVGCLCLGTLQFSWFSGTLLGILELECLIFRCSVVWIFSYLKNMSFNNENEDLARRLRVSKFPFK